MTDTPTVTLGAGHVVVWLDEDGDHQAATITEIDGDFVRVGGMSNPHWLRRDDIVALGVYGDEQPIRDGEMDVVIGDE